MTMNLRNSLLAVPAAALLINTGAHAIIVLGNGQTLNLGTLMAMNDRRVAIDDKIFNFESYNSTAFDASKISLVGFISQSTNQYGLHNVGFDLTGPFGDGFPGDGNVQEGNLQYTVEVEQSYYASGVRLCDVRSVFNGDAGGAGSYSRVDETVFDVDGNTFLGELEVHNIATATGNDEHLMDYRDFCDDHGTNGYRAFEVNKDFKFFASTESGFASCSFIRQEFSQIPAPGALALLGVAGMLGARRRR